MTPIFEVYLVGFVDEQNVSLASSDFLRLVDANELDHIPPQLIGCIALIVEVGVVYILPVEYLEEVPHRCCTKCWECLPANGNYEAAVLVAKFYEALKYRVCLAGSRPALVYLDALL